jgi:Zn-dependent M28 family amino/carboxypeptidase
LLYVSSFLLLGGCSPTDADLDNALATINAKDLAEDIATLASDAFEGRQPASRGEALTINFLRDEFQKLGLVGGNGDSYFQEVPLVEIEASPDASLEFKYGSKTERYAYGRQFMAWTTRVVARSSISESELVFVGYGVVAPEYEWDDYRDVDVRGKTVVILVNDPGFASQNDALFNGNAMTYYGRWTYKFEEAARQGAAAALIVHETEPAGYPWEVVADGWSGKQFELLSDDNNMSRCAIEGWLHVDAAKRLFKHTGTNFVEAKTAALSKGFSAASLKANASLTLMNTIAHSISNNVVAVLPGKKQHDEYVFYVAHWDHFGVDPNREGDKIFNGAQDNATGTAALLELAEAFSQLEHPPARSIVFLALTAEEQGVMLGSKHYAERPLFPRHRTVAVLNMDLLNIYGKMKDVTIVGFGNSELDDYVLRAAEKQQRVVRADPEPEKGYFYRSDHFNFAKFGIPALYTKPGIDHVEHGSAWTLEQFANYRQNLYHKPSDEYDPNWDLSGAIDDLRLLFMVGYRLSMETTFPNWREGNEFRAIRDADLQISLMSNE